MKCKKLFVLMLSMLLITVSMFSASAAKDITKTYYVNGYDSYGTTITSSSMVYSSTYCEYIGYGKAVYVEYYYTVNGVSYPDEFGNNDSFVVNGFETYSVDETLTSYTCDVYSAEGIHKVKASSTVMWNSDLVNDNTYVRGI